MGYTLTIFGVEKETDETVLCEALARLGRWLEKEGALPVPLAAVVTKPVKTKPLRWMVFYCDPDDPTALSQGAVLEILGETISPLTMVVHDDRTGQFSFVHTEQGKPVLALHSDGPYLQVLRGEVTVDHPQKGFTHDALRALHEKPESALSDREYKAIAEYDSALKIGLKQRYPSERWPRQLDVLGGKTQGWWIAKKGPLKAPAPLGKDLERVEAKMRLAIFPEQTEGWYIDALFSDAGAEGSDEGDEDEDPEAELAALDEAIAAEPPAIDLRIERISVLAQDLGRLEEALTEAAALRGLGVREGSLYDAESWVLAEVGRTREARDAIAQALELEPANATHWYNHACYSACLSEDTRSARERKELEKQSLASLRRAIDLDPVNREDAANDDDFESLRKLAEFKRLTRG